MKILYISYWGATEGLTAATVLPHLEILQKFEEVEKIIFCSVERDPKFSTPLEPRDKIIHKPLISKGSGSVFITKANDFQHFPKQLVQICIEHQIDLIICRTSLAGALGYLVTQKIKIPYVVESFEPHADYMVESGVWKSFDPRLWIQRYFEKRIKGTAKILLPVSEHYHQKLLQEGIAENRIILQPCCISIENFSYKKSDRDRIRAMHQIGEHAVVGIYVGKFGGIYYDHKAFALYADAFRFFKEDFVLIILTADDHGMVKNFASSFNLPMDRVVIEKVSHAEVPAYLSAADFAFSTIKPAPSRIYCSPIKNGEYWANGLPILTEDNIGDDSSIISREGGGVILRQEPREALVRLKDLISKGREQLFLEIQPIARKHRDMGLIRASYDRILSSDFRKFQDILNNR